MAKKEKVVDLKPKAEKITDEELNKLQGTVRSIDQLVLDIGRLELQKHSMLATMDKYNEGIERLRQDFIENYGTDNVNIQSGVIAYPEENKEDGEVNKKD